MGDTAELILEGVLCEQCGGLVEEDGEDCGYPRKCEFCKKEHQPC